jgi:hypothetical protein
MIKGEKSVEPHHLLNLKVTEPLSVSERGHPVAVVRWIHRNVPSFAGRVPVEWTDAVIKSLEKQLVHDYVIAHSMKLARRPGYDFGEIEILRLAGRVTWHYKEAQPPANYVQRVPLPSMGQGEPITAADAIRQAELIEAKYILAVKTNDYTAQAGLLSAFKDLVRKLVAAAMIGRRLKEHEDRQSAGEQLRNRAHQQLRLTAPTLMNDAQNLERQGIPNPTARDVQNRIAPLRPSQRSKPRK